VAGVNLVWFKKDLRTSDHAPLSTAVATGRPCVCLFIHEPSMIHAPVFDSAHFVYQNQCLEGLAAELQAAGIQLTIRIGEAVAVLEALHQDLGIAALYSHEETGTWASYQRDLAVKAWAQDHGIPWHESPSNGLVRRLKSREGWAQIRNKRMAMPLLAAPLAITGVDGLDPGPWPTLADVGLPPCDKTGLQPGGRAQALADLKSFIDHRGLHYAKALSSPVTAFEACSRLSPALAFGSISSKETLAIIHEAVARREGHASREWFRSMTAFEKRLAWRCHFIQKLEDQPDLEWTNANRAYDGLRESEFDAARFQAYCTGQTGYPMIDACMRALRATGWINFRMRAMLMSFAAYQLWLDWRPVAEFLARQFVDFEPGIHYTQCQMQSGVTGINAIRIYSPIKQALDQDPHGTFIRQWVPELAAVPTEYLHDPRQMPSMVALMVGFELGRDYPAPIVDPVEAYKQAKVRIFEWKRRPEAKAAAAEVFAKHGSRNRSPDQRKRDYQQAKATKTRAAKAAMADPAESHQQILLLPFD
jgi:deoxyribodipyrimidine photo-lyase